MDIQRIKNIKKNHMIVSFVVFFAVVIYGVFKIDLSLMTNPLSKFGIHEETDMMWICTLLFVSSSMWINSITNTIESNLEYKKTTHLIFTSAALSLVGVSLINMNNQILHNLCAAFFFLSYAGGIFFTGMQMIKSDLRIAMTSISISILMILCFMGLLIRIQSVSEIIFISLAFVWNFIIIYSNKFKSALKIFGF